MAVNDDMAWAGEHGSTSFPPPSHPLVESAGEWWAGIANWRLYMWMAWQATRQRYAGSVIGPFWVSISMGAFVIALGFLFGNIMTLPREVYVPYLASGMIVWATISGMISDGSRLLYGNRHILLSQRLPFSVLPMQVIANQAIVFAHNSVVYVLVAFYFGVPLTPLGLAMALTGLALLFLNGLWLCAVLSLVCCRYRDCTEIVAIVLQFGFYLTPIVWSPSKLGEQQWLVDWNPLAHFLAVVREPLLGGMPTQLDWLVAGGAAALGLPLALAAFASVRSRYVYWV